MTTVLLQATSAIANHYSDVIEGGNAYASGTSYDGIPGTQSLHELDGRTLTASQNSSAANEFTATQLAASDGLRIDRERSAPFFAVCTSGTAANIGAARKITAYSPTTNRYTFGTSWPSTPQSGDAFVLREGFRRVGDSYDIESDEAEGAGHDRAFHLVVPSGMRMDWHGSGKRTLRSTATLTLRLLTRARVRKTSDAAIECMQNIVHTITRSSLRDSTYVQLLDAQEPATIASVSDNRILVSQNLTLIYRITDTLL